MRISNADATIYPRTAGFIQHEVPQLVHRRRGLAMAFKLHTGLDLRGLVGALRWKSPPRVEIVALPGQYGSTSDGYVCARAGLLVRVLGGCQRDVIGVGSHVARAFEQGADRPQPLEGGGGPPVTVLEATLVHELAHWARAASGRPTQFEEGSVVERLVYGGLIGYDDPEWMEALFGSQR